MKKPPEQDIADYLFVSGYKPGTIIAYLEGLANSGRFEFAEGDYVDFTVCERPDGTRYGTDGECNPETGKPASPSAGESKPGDAKGKTPAPPKEEKPDKTVEELRMEKMKKTAAKQGSDPTNNRKVVIDGNAYGWAMKGGKWTMVPWGSVAGIKTVGPKQPPARGGGRGGRRGRGQSGDSGYIQGLRIALDKQSSDAGRESIMELIREAGGQV